MDYFGWGNSSFNFRSQTVLEGGPVTPGDLANLVRWYKADSLSLGDSTPVTTWADDSPLSNDIVQGSGTLKPTFLNAEPSVFFDGGDVLKDFSAYINGIGSNKQFTIGIVYTPTVMANRTLVGGGLTSDFNYYWKLNHAANGFQWLCRSNGATQSVIFGDIIPVLGTQYIIFVTMSATGTIKLYRYTGGSLVQSSTVTTTTEMPLVNIDTFALGGIISGGASSSFMTGRLNEYFQSTDELGQDTLIEQGAALSEKWGVI